MPSRRRALQMLGALTAVGAGGWALLAGGRANAYYHLPRIDAVLVTHNHYDHMDVETIGRLWQRFRPRIVVPLGNDTILKRDVPGLTASVVDWGDAVDLGGGVTVHVEPTLHWSARGAGDRMHALWASFV